MDEYLRGPGQGDIVDLGVISMRLILSRSETKGALAVAEFQGSPGRWTVPHVHERTEESFYVLDGTFTFTCAGRDIEAEQGALVRVPPGTPHVIQAAAGGGSLLALWTPGGLEEMFLELGRLPANSITDPEVRAEVAKRHDSVPV